MALDTTRSKAASSSGDENGVGYDVLDKQSLENPSLIPLEEAQHLPASTKNEDGDESQLSNKLTLMKEKKSPSSKLGNNGTKDPSTPQSTTKLAYPPRL